GKTETPKRSQHDFTGAARDPQPEKPRQPEHEKGDHHQESLCHPVLRVGGRRGPGPDDHAEITREQHRRENTARGRWRNAVGTHLLVARPRSALASDILVSDTGPAPRARRTCM